MDNYRLIIYAKKNTIKNVIRVFYFKYPVQLILSIVGLIMIVLIFNNQLESIFLENIIINPDYNLIANNFFIKTILLSIVLSILVISFSRKSSISFYDKVRNFPININKVYKLNLIMYYSIFYGLGLIIFLLYLSYGKATFQIYFILISTLLITGINNVFIDLIVNIKKEKYVIYIIKSYLYKIILFLIQKNLYKNIHLNIYYKIILILFIPLIILGSILYKNNKLNIELWKNRNNKETKVLKINFIKNSYYNLLVKETIRNKKIYLSLIIVFSIPIIYLKNSILIPEYLQFYSFSLLMVIPISLYNSYKEVYTILPIKKAKHLVNRLIFSSVIFTICYLTINFISDFKFNFKIYLATFTLGVLLYFINYLTEICIIINNNENATFYIFNMCILLVYSIITDNLTSILSEIYAINIEIYKINLIILFSFLLVFYFILIRKKEQEKE